MVLADPTCQKVAFINYIYHSIREILFFTCLQQDTLNHIHEGHKAIAKCRLLAHTSVWWLTNQRDDSEIYHETFICQVLYPRHDSFRQWSTAFVPGISRVCYIKTTILSMSPAVLTTLKRTGRLSEQ